MQITPWVSLNSSREVPGRGQRGERGLTGQIRRRRSPAARVEGRGSERKSRCTPGWLARSRGGSELGRRWRAAVVGARDMAAGWLRWRLGEEEGFASCARSRRSYWRGFRGGVGLEWRFQGGPELAGVQWLVVVFWDVEAAKERGYQGNRMRGCSWF